MQRSLPWYHSHWLNVVFIYSLNGVDQHWLLGQLQTFWMNVSRSILTILRILIVTTICHDRDHRLEIRCNSSPFTRLSVLQCEHICIAKILHIVRIMCILLEITKWGFSWCSTTYMIRGPQHSNAARRFMHLMGMYDSDMMWEASDISLAVYNMQSCRFHWKNAVFGTERQAGYVEDSDGGREAVILFRSRHVLDASTWLLFGPPLASHQENISPWIHMYCRGFMTIGRTSVNVPWTFDYSQ